MQGEGAALVRGDALRIPLADECVDLVVTSPPFLGLRSYRDNGQHYDGQLGSESTQVEFLNNLMTVMREVKRVLKPTGSIFVELGDSYRDKCLQFSPERFRIRCVDDLRFIARAVIVWNRPNGLPESVTDRVRRAHSDWVHLTKQGRYFAAVDEIRESYAPSSIDRSHLLTTSPERPGDIARVASGDKMVPFTEAHFAGNPLGKLPGSVWTIPSEPLIIPEAVQRHYNLPDHFAAFPQEWPRRIILGWSPNGVCVECGEGRRPVVAKEYRPNPKGGYLAFREADDHSGDQHDGQPKSMLCEATITGYACACAPQPREDRPLHDEAGTCATCGDNRRAVMAKSQRLLHTQSRIRGPMALDDPHDRASKGCHGAGENKAVTATDAHVIGYSCSCIEGLPPTRPAVVLDPFGGTGTVSMVARALGRFGVGIDLSADYNRLARWRIFESQHGEKAMQRTHRENQGDLFANPQPTPPSDPQAPGGSMDDDAVRPFLLDQDDTGGST